MTSCKDSSRHWQVVSQVQAIKKLIVAERRSGERERERDRDKVGRNLSRCQGALKILSLPLKILAF